MRNWMAALGAPAMLLAAQPAMAQHAHADHADHADHGEDAALAALSGLFPVEPLTPAQQERLPLAREVIDIFVPEGAMGELMGGMMNGVLGPIMELANETSAADIAADLGQDLLGQELSEQQVAELSAILDPAREERARRVAAVMPEVMAKLFAAMEPTMRSAMAEAYAVYFTTGELTDIRAFFLTPSGASYARKSLTMSADPRFVGAMMQAMPQMMSGFEEMETKIAAATSHLPALRAYADLSRAEIARLVEVTGLDRETIAEGMAAAAAAREQE